VYLDASHDISPRKKQKMEQQLALAALTLIHTRDIMAPKPTIVTTSHDNQTLKIRFNNVASGLTTADGAPPRGFLIAGADRVWKVADARIEGLTVIVSSGEITEPVAVRYGWANDPAATLRSQADLPVAPFRSDDWSNVPATATAK